MTLEEVRRLLEMSPTSPSWPSKELCSLIILLRALMFAVLEQDFKQGFQLPSVGYVVLPTETIPELMAIDLPWNQNNLRDLFGEGVPRSASEIFADVERLKPSTWPLLKGPVFRISGEQTIIDLDSATGLLDRMFTIPSQFGGALVNARAEHFEDYVQQVIDQSSWAPSPALRGYKRKTLRLGGKSVTDIDAIAVKGKNIILVSCKSIPYTFDYDMGIYNTVRNVRTLLEDADGEWRDRLAVLRANPSGDNYNFEAYDLLGVVCTPHVFFVNEPQARIILQADDKVLRAICSVTELRRFLMLEPADAQAPARQE